mgnify:CR=1 FL=1
MRTIKTNSGQEYSGLTSSFEDKGDYVLKKGNTSDTKIPKQSIIYDNTSKTLMDSTIGVTTGRPFTE